MFSNLEGNHITTDLIELLLGSECNHHLQNKSVVCHIETNWLWHFALFNYSYYNKIEKKFLRVLFIPFFPFAALVRMLGFSMSFWLPALRKLSFPSNWAWGFLHHMLLHRDLWELATGRSAWKKVAEIFKMSLASALLSAHITQSRICP